MRKLTEAIIKGNLVSCICKAKSLLKWDFLVDIICAMARKHAFQVDYFSLYSLSHGSSWTSMYFEIVHLKLDSV